MPDPVLEGLIPAVVVVTRPFDVVNDVTRQAKVDTQLFPLGG